jgi:putative addiction module killer protein
MYELKLFVKGDRAPFTEWLRHLKDVQARARIRTRLDRLSLGNFGDHRALDSGVFELKIDWGPGYRVYCAKTGKTIILLLCGGDKKSQASDIRQAKAYLKEYEHAQND